MPTRVVRGVLRVSAKCHAILASVDELDRVVALYEVLCRCGWDLRLVDRLIIADSWTSKASEILAARPDRCDRCRSVSEAAVVEI